MRFGINALRLSGQRLGIGRYIEYLLEGLGHHARRRASVSSSTFASRSTRTNSVCPTLSRCAHLPSRTTVCAGSISSSPATGARPTCSSVRATRFRCTTAGRLVVATHSVNEAEPGTHPLVVPPHVSAAEQAVARRSDAVIVPSRTTQGHVESLYGVAPEKITIVPEGARRSFAPVEDEAVLAATRQRLSGRRRPVRALRRQALPAPQHPRADRGVRPA